MSNHYYKNKLYPLQDKVMELMGQVDSPFYLTGGTLLSRFILHHRYSDDLDFFTNDSKNFFDEIDMVMKPVQNEIQSVELVTRQDSYVRYRVTENQIELKVEFVNDVRYTVEEKVRAVSGIRFDHWKNVLSNKVTALSRKAAKDLVDILFLSHAYSFNWEKIIDQAKMKDASVNEIEVSQYFYNFDLSRLNEVNFPETFKSTVITTDHLITLAKDSLHGFDNSLHGKTLGE